MNVKSSPVVAALQLTSTNDVDKNLKECEDLLKQVQHKDIDLLLLPETFAFMGHKMEEQALHGEDEGKGKVQDWLSKIAQELSCFVIAGTVALKSTKNKVSASSLVYSPQGECIARYDKIHLFDVSLPEQNKTFKESVVFTEGNTPAMVDTSAGKVGLSVCYDLRFPEMYRLYAEQGADILTVPAAFTHETGEAHWETLLRARAIENQCFVIASGQTGVHVNGRRSFGHSMIIDPWGEVLSVLPEGSGIVIATLDREKQQTLRESFPVLAHRKPIRGTMSNT